MHILSIMLPYSDIAHNRAALYCKENEDRSVSNCIRQFLMQTLASGGIHLGSFLDKYEVLFQN